AQLRDEIDRVRTSDQAEVNKLLTASGPELVGSVARAFTELGISVINVDDQGGRDGLDEDLWLSKRPITGAEADVTHLCEVKGHRRQTCTDDDFGALGKYLRRRSVEWKRT